jgi:hypothetical protein
VIIMAIEISADDYSFVAATVQQLHPTMRETFATRVHAALAELHEPGPGDVDRAVRTALKGIWDPPLETAPPPRWSRVRKSDAKAAL